MGTRLGTPWKLPVILALAAILALGLAACGGDDDDEPAGEQPPIGTVETMPGTETLPGTDSIIATAQTAPELSTFVDAVTAAGLAETLNADGPFTVFAPTNDAFEALPEGELERLLEPENVDELGDLLTFHVVDGDLTSDQLSEGDTLQTVQGADLEVTVTDEGAIRVGDATVTMPDTPAANGVIHIVDRVLAPDDT